MKKRISAVLIISALFVLSVFTFVPDGVLGDTEYLDPNGDAGPNEWSTSGCSNHYDCVDDAVREPTEPTWDDYLQTGSGDITEKFYYTDTGGSGTVSQVDIWIYAQAGDTNDRIAFYPLIPTIWNPSSKTVTPGTTASWKSVSWTDLSIDRSDFDDLRIGHASKVTGGSGGDWRITASYVILTYSAVTPASLTVTLRRSDNYQEQITVGFWGNVTATPGGTLVNSTNFVRAQCDDCDGVDDAFWVNWSGTTWDSTDTGDTITIDGNYRLWYYETTSGSADPDDGGWSWSDSGVDADGDYQITFENSGTTYVWVRYRIEAVPSPLSGCDDLKQEYTVELDR